MSVREGRPVRSDGAVVGLGPETGEPPMGNRKGLSHSRLASGSHHPASGGSANLVGTADAVRPNVRAHRSKSPAHTREDPGRIALAT